MAILNLDVRHSLLLKTDINPRIVGHLMMKGVDLLLSEPKPLFSSLDTSCKTGKVAHNILIFRALP